MGESFMIFMLISLLCEVSAGVKINDCPESCSCLGTVIDCSHHNLSYVPKMPLLPEWTEKLNLRGVRLTDNDIKIINTLTKLTKLKLEKNSLHEVPKFDLVYLEDLSLTKNNISVITTGSFPVNNSLKRLNLNNNNINTIENNSLQSLTKLNELKLNKNQITQLPNHLFKNLSQLTKLELNHNRIHTLNGLLFEGLLNLTILKLEHNIIHSITDGAFYGFKAIDLLLLNNNRIRSVSKGWMYGLETLNNLSLANNHISLIDVGSWELCSNLEHLDMSHNHLTEINGHSLENLSKLKSLNLNNNNISSITQDAFSHVIYLTSLSLDNNKISWTIEDMVAPFSKLQNLTVFSLKSNHVKSINSRAFEGLSNIESLDLSGNNITYIQPHAFDSTSKLKELHLNSSSLLCDCNLHWLAEWIRQKHNQKFATATCSYPSEMKGLALYKLKEDGCGDSPKPKIIEHPKSHMAIKGKPTNIVCSATSNPFSNLTFLWKKNNGNISNPLVYQNVTINKKGKKFATSFLVVPNVSHADSGKYQCVVSNDFGITYSSKAKVSIVTLPKFIKLPSNVTVKTGETVKLNCAATGDPSPEISWKKDGGNDFPAARERRMNVMPTDHMFFIVNAKTTDMGIYSCAAKNPAGTLIANASLTVLEEPSFVRVMENKEVTSGESVVLQCMISGSPKPVLKWSKDGLAIVPSDRHYFTADDQLLVIVGTESSDGGKYECEITNDLGTKKDMIELRVLPPVAIMVNEENMTGIIIITIVCCAVATSAIWVVIIYHTRRRMMRSMPPFPTDAIKMAHVVHGDPDSPYVFPDNVSEHSSCKDSGTGDSAKQTSIDGVPTDRSEQVQFETTAIYTNYSLVPEAHKLLPSSFKPSIQVCVNSSVTPATYSFSSHNNKLNLQRD